MKKRNAKKTTNKNQIKLELIPILFVVCVLPFVVRMEIITTGLQDASFLPAVLAQRADFFLYWKSCLFVVSVIIMGLVLLDYFVFRKGRDKDWKRWIPLLGYEVLTVLSALCSSYSRYAMDGMMEHFENVWVLIGYGIVAYYTYTFIENQNDVDIVLGGMLFSASVQSMLGLFQMIGIDILNTEFVKNLMIPAKYLQYKDQIVFNFSEEMYQKVSTTLYNPNYAGVYFAMILPIALTAIIYFKGKRRVMAAVISIAVFLCLIGTGSKSAILTFFMLLILGVVLIGRNNKKYCFAGVISAAILLFLWFGYDKLTGLDTGKRVAESMKLSVQEYKLQDISLLEDMVEVTFDGRRIKIGWEKAGEALYLDVRDEAGEQMGLRDNKKKRRVRLIDPHFKGLQLWCYRKDGIPYLCMKYDGQEWKFTDATEDGTLKYINIWGKADEIETAGTVLFEGRETWFTYRGYIWGRTIPLLKDYLILGSGPDTFLFVFPQKDYVMRSNMGWGFFSEILTKPHSMYLQMAVQTGVISMLLFLVWIGITMREFLLRLHQKTSKIFRDYMVLGIFLSVIGYLIMAVFNDSMIVTAPLFFALIGMGKKACKIGAFKN